MAETTSAARKLKSLIVQMRTISPTMPVQVIHTFISVAENEGKSLAEIADAHNGNMSTASRHLLDLGERNRKGEPGYGLVERRVSEEELRKNSYTLTPRGKMIYKQFLATIGD